MKKSRKSVNLEDAKNIVKKEINKLLWEHAQKDTIQKINAINLLIGYIVRKGLVSELPIDTLKEIADDYEKRLEENE